jgi:hypothetical protein
MIMDAQLNWFDDVYACPQLVSDDSGCLAEVELMI